METLTLPSAYELERHKPLPSRLHSITQSNLNFQLQLHYREKYRFMSELSLELRDWPSVPDLCIYPKTAVDFLEDEVNVMEAPLCAIEILSPSQSLNELVAKAGKYFEHGVISCWLVIPLLKNIYVFSDREHYETFKSPQTLQDPALGLNINLSEVFV